ncbi:MAG TPA: peptide deformylase [Candidatus Azoamicus sp. OHIO2]
MSVLTVLKFPDAMLNKKANKIYTIDKELLLIITDLIETMFYYDALGIAATQVRIDKRIIIINMSNNYIIQPFVLINPEILFHRGSFISDEGCLSFPNLFVKIKRDKDIYIKFVDITGLIHFLKASNMLSICAQHEIDHINGLTIYDRTTNLKKKIILKNFT